jgi:ParB family chromosome partitioning protein
VALPHLVKRKDLDGLLAVAVNKKLPEATRLGAVEGLAALGDERAEAKLVEIGKTEAEPEDVRKAAWRGVKRSRRLREKAKAFTTEAQRTQRSHRESNRGKG